MELWFVPAFLVALLVVTIFFGTWFFVDVYNEIKAEKEENARKMRYQEPEVDYEKLQEIAYKRSFIEICKEI